MGLDSEYDSYKIDGATDGTQIGNIGDRLKVTGDELSSSDAGGCPVLSPNIRYVIDLTDVSLTAAYQTIYSYTGSGKVTGFIADVESTNTEFKITIDSTNVIIETSMIDLGSITGNKEFAIGGINTDASFKKLLVEPLCPFEYTSEFKVEARSATSKKLFGYIVSLTKET